jgi:hypothetical protein
MIQAQEKYFDPFPLHLVRKTSPIRSMTNEQWNDLEEYWKNPKKMVHFVLKAKLLLIHATLTHALHAFCFDIGHVSEE